MNKEISEIPCPMCKGVATPVKDILNDDASREEFFCPDCHRIFSRMQVVGIIFALDARKRINSKDLTQEEEHMIMQRESMHNLFAEIDARKEVACAN